MTNEWIFIRDEYLTISMNQRILTAMESMYDEIKFSSSYGRLKRLKSLLFGIF